MRKVLRFFEIFITGMLLTVFVLTYSLSGIFFNQDTLKNSLSDSRMYEKINDVMIKKAKEELAADFNNYPELKDRLDDMIKNVLTEDVLKKTTSEVLTQVYSGKENVTFNASLLIKEYKINLDKYLEKEKINLPSDVKSEIDKLYNELDNEKIDLTDFSNEVLPNIERYHDIVKFVVYLPLFVAIILIGTAVSVSKEKLRVIYKPLLFSGILLLVSRVICDIFISAIKLDADMLYFKELLTSIKYSIFSGIDKFTIIFLVVGVILMIIRIVLDKKKNNANKVEEDKENLSLTEEIAVKIEEPRNENTEI